MIIESFYRSKKYNFLVLLLLLIYVSYNVFFIDDHINNDGYLYFYQANLFKNGFINEALELNNFFLYSYLNSFFISSANFTFFSFKIINILFFISTWFFYILICKEIFKNENQKNLLLIGTLSFLSINTLVDDNLVRIIRDQGAWPFTMVGFYAFHVFYTRKKTDYIYLFIFLLSSMSALFFRIDYILFFFIFSMLLIRKSKYRLILTSLLLGMVLIFIIIFKSYLFNYFNTFLISNKQFFVNRNLYLDIDRLKIFSESFLKNSGYFLAILPLSFLKFDLYKQYNFRLVNLAILSFLTPVFLNYILSDVLSSRWMVMTYIFISFYVVGIFFSGKKLLLQKKQLFYKIFLFYFYIVLILSMISNIVDKKKLPYNNNLLFQEVIADRNYQSNSLKILFMGNMNYDNFLKSSGDNKLCSYVNLIISKNDFISTNTMKVIVDNFNLLNADDKYLIYKRKKDIDRCI